MKRDMDLVRKILFTMEESDDAYFYAQPLQIEIEGYTEPEILYHMHIMSQANLLYSDRRERLIGGYSHVNHIYSISWQGHEFLTALRDETRWKEVKKIMVKAGGFVTEVALDIAKEMVKQAAWKMISP